MQPQPRHTHRPARFTGRLRRLSIPVLTLATSLALASCAGHPADGTSAAQRSSVAASDDAFPVSVTSGSPQDGQQVTIEQRPDSIVSLSPTATETLWAVGAGDQVVAVDDQSDYPSDVPTTALSGYTPNIEAILAYEPDLVLTANDDNDLVAGLEAAAVPTLVLPSAADLEEAYAQIERVGAATGHVAEAARLVADMQADIDAALADAPMAAGLSYFHELDPTLYSVTEETFIGEVYGLFGMRSIADEVAGGDDYPQLSAEYVVDADPEVIVLADAECCGVTPKKAAARPGWAGITAVRTGQVHAVDEDIASRWGPRVVEFVEMISELVQVAEPVDAG